MFKNLVDFSYKRTPKEAIGFYFAYLLLNMIIGGVIGGIFASGNTFSSGFFSGLAIGPYCAVLTQFVIGAMLLNKRRKFLYIIVVCLSVFLSYYGGGLLGLIPLAYLTTRNSAK